MLEKKIGVSPLCDRIDSLYFPGYMSDLWRGYHNLPLNLDIGY